MMKTMMKTPSRIGIGVLILALLGVIAWLMSGSQPNVSLLDGQGQTDNRDRNDSEAAVRRAQSGTADEDVSGAVSAAGRKPIGSEPIGSEIASGGERSFVVACVDLANGDPLAGVELTLKSLRFGRGRDRPQPAYSVAAGKPIAGGQQSTDSKGRAEFSIPEGVHWVQVGAEKQGYHPVGRTQAHPVTDKPIRILFYKKLILAGVTLDEEGRPVPKARVSITALATQLGQATAPTSKYLGRSDEVGRFEFEAPALLFGKVRMVAWKRGYLSSSQPLELHPPMARTSLRLTLKSGNSFSFLIKDMKGKPVAGALVTLTQYAWPTDWGGHVRGHELGGQTMGIGAAPSLRSDADGRVLVQHWPTGTPAVFTIGGRPEKKSILKVSPSFAVKQPEPKMPDFFLFQPDADQVYTIFLELWEAKTIVVKGVVHASAGFDRSKFGMKLGFDGGVGAWISVKSVKWDKNRFEVRYQYPRRYVEAGMTAFTIRVFLAKKEVAAFGPYDYYKDTLIQGLLVLIK